MTAYEFTGRSVKEAIAKACEELNLDEALLEVDVIEESTRGFLGIVGHRDARVRVRKRDILREVMEADEQQPQAAPERSVPKPSAPKPSPKPSAPEGSVPEPSGPPEAEEEAPADFEPEEAPAPRSVVDASPFLDEARTVLEGMLGRIPVDAEVVASIEDGAIYLDIKGDGSGLLIGKKGQTLDALQFLVNKIINKGNPPGAKVEVIVDTENYRVRKRENLRETAVKASEKAKKTVKPVSLNPMPAAERRLIHLILAEDKDVYTKSYGEGPLRRIIVYPRRGLGSKRRRG